MFSTSATINRPIALLIMIAVVLGGALLSVNPFTNVTSARNSIECTPKSGWVLTNTFVKSEHVSTIIHDLAESGINATISAQNIGETDSCGVFLLQSTDFSIKLSQSSNQIPQQQLIETIYETLLTYTDATIGHIELQFSDSPNKQYIRYNQIKKSLSLTTERSLSTDFVSNTVDKNVVSAENEALALPPATDLFNQNVLIIVYDPILNNGDRLSDFLNWENHSDLTQGTINHFTQSSNNRVLYNVVETIVIDGWPEKTDGFVYTEEEYLDVYNGQSDSHSPDNVDYNKIVNDPQFDICGKANRNEIDEVWIYNGPWFGFYESTLVGPNGYSFNSSPVPEPHNCNRLIPIMGPSPERHLESAIHNFGHRTEATMEKVYGSWSQNSISHGWEKFGLVDVQSSDFSYSGCGSTHYPPNALDSYQYGNSSNSASTNCDDFFNYSDLSNPQDVLQPITCSAWGCNEVGYHDYWFTRLPSNEGCDEDDVANDWWQYFVNPGLANNPSSLCPEPPTATPTNTSTPTATATQSPSPTATPTHTVPPTNTPTVTHTPTLTLTPMPTSTPTVVPTATSTPIVPSITPTSTKEPEFDHFNFLPFILN